MGLRFVRLVDRCSDDLLQFAIPARNQLPDSCPVCSCFPIDFIDVEIHAEQTPLNAFRKPLKSRLNSLISRI